MYYYLLEKLVSACDHTGKAVCVLWIRYVEMLTTDISFFCQAICFLPPHFPFANARRAHEISCRKMIQFADFFSREKNNQCSRIEREMNFEWIYSFWEYEIAFSLPLSGFAWRARCMPKNALEILIEVETTAKEKHCVEAQNLASGKISASCTRCDSWSLVSIWQTRRDIIKP